MTHVSQIRNSYFSTSATISDSKSFWTSCLLLNLLPAPTSFTQTASTNLHPELYSKHSHQVATHPISLKKFRANKLHLQQQVSYKPLHCSCRVPSFPLNNFISDWCFYQNLKNLQAGTSLFTPVKSIHTFCTAWTTAHAAITWVWNLQASAGKHTQTASKAVLTPPALLLQTNRHTQSRVVISDITLCLDENYRPVLQPHCWAKQLLSTTPLQGKGNPESLLRVCSFLMSCLDAAPMEESSLSIRGISQAWTITLNASYPGSGQENHKEQKIGFDIFKDGKNTLLHARRHVSRTPKTTPTLLVICTFPFLVHH